MTCLMPPNSSWMKEKEMGFVVFVDLALGLGFGLGGGLLLAVIAWLALLTICACRKIRLVAIMFVTGYKN